MYFNENSLICLNGNLSKVDGDKQLLFAQTMHYGYGVFEGIRSYKTQNGTKVFKAKEHFDRLRNSCKLLHIPIQYSTEELESLTYALLEANSLEDAYIRPLVYASPNMSLTSPAASELMIAAWSWNAYLGDKLLKVKTSSYCRPHPKSIHIEAKACGHYVNSTLATTEAKMKGYDEAMLLDSDGFLAEGPGANLFFEKEGKLFTPKLGNILPGITRATILELCQSSGISIAEGKYLPQDLYTADSAFYCGTAAEVVGFEKIDDYMFPLAWEQSLGKKLQTAYKNLVIEKY